MALHASAYLFTLCALGATPISAAAEPNIIIFLVDDMGVMDTSLPLLCSATGEAQRHALNDWYRTPHMEQLAKQGVAISRFYAQSVSSPSRVSLITGQNSTRHAVTNYIHPTINNRGKFGPPAWNWAGLEAKDITLASVLKSAGYQTFHLGKAHFAPKGGAGENPCALGYDVNVAGCCIGQPGSYLGEDGYGKIKGDQDYAVPGLEKYHGTDTFLTEALTLEAKELITQAAKSGRPFFLNISHYALHAPFYADPRFIAHYPQCEGKSQAACHFASLVEGMDKSLGDIVTHLKDLGVADNTFIIFLGDNGSDAPLGEAQGYSSSAPLRGKKATCYEGGVRVPFIAAWAQPNKEQPNQQSFAVREGMLLNCRASIMDVYPTVLELARAQNPPEHPIDGFSLLPLLRGEGDDNRQDDILMHFPHEHRDSYFTTYIHGDWKLIYHYMPQRPEYPCYELYNLKEDPYEQENRYFTEEALTEEMIAGMRLKLQAQGAQMPINNQLEALPLPFYRAPSHIRADLSNAQQLAIPVPNDEVPAHQVDKGTR